MLRKREEGGKGKEGRSDKKLEKWEGRVHKKEGRRGEEKLEEQEGRMHRKEERGAKRN